MHSLLQLTLFMMGMAVSHYALAQDEHPYLKQFEARLISGQIHLNWTTKAGFSCQDIHIEVSTDSVNFRHAGTYFGLCGDATERSYTYLLEEPIPNHRNYIRLDLGTFGYSHIIAIDVVRVNDRALVAPHPITPKSIIHFKNDERNEAVIMVYGADGSTLYEATSSDDQFELGHLTHQQGLLFYRLEVGDKIEFGKLITQGS